MRSFNHRFSKRTGVRELEELSEYISHDYKIFCTDMRTPKSDKYIVSETNISRQDYKYLLKNSFGTICIINKYITWNLSIQDALLVGRPSFILYRKEYKSIVGKDYPYFFNDFEELKKKLDNFKELTYKINDYDRIFMDNIAKMFENTRLLKLKISPENKLYKSWIEYIIENKQATKLMLMKHKPPVGFIGNIRRYILLNEEIEDDITSSEPLYKLLT